MQAISHGAASAATQPTTAAPRLIAIVGAGFSGLAVAIRLLRQPAREALRIVLIEPRAEIGAGVAYATRDYPYPLNVAAGQMSLDGAHPADFLDFVRAQGIDAVATDYLPRQVYGEYLRARFAAACAAAPRHVHCVHHRARALQLRRAADGRFDLWLDDGTALRPDDVVLALGNPPPACLPQLAGICATDRYVPDPWSIGELARQEIGSVLLIGSGLTMIDAALRLAAIRPRVRHIHVLSRHGLLPLPQAAAFHALKPDVSAALAAAQGSVRRLFRAFRVLARDALAAGGDWREIFGLARGQLPALWRGLDRAQHARFLRHARPLWEVHRHRVPAGPLSAVQALARSAVLDLHAGRLEAVNAVENAIEVSWLPRGAGKARAWLVDRVINCTGPDASARRNPDPLVQSLLSNGLIRCDALELGIDVAPDGRVIAASGAPVDRLYYIGPWLRARDWEATAVPELREHAAALARKLAESGAGKGLSGEENGDTPHFPGSRAKGAGPQPNHRIE
jgi:uncharacterized NAD(P)/FAD-binding protein YdhS